MNSVFAFADTDSGTVLFTGPYSYSKFRDRQPAIKAYTTLLCGDTVAVWLPVFTDWFTTR